ncbi:MAG: ribonuclease activity regulator RraA [Flavobacteriaceae bacterium]
MKLQEIQAFKQISTPTIATFLFKKGLKNQCIQGIQPVHNVKESMIGFAFTLRYIPAREDLNSIKAFQDPKHPQRVAIETCPEDSVLVIDSRKDASAASAGDLLITRLKMRGAQGIVTDGGFRDSKAIHDLEFPTYHQRPSAPTNLTKHQAIDINLPVSCGDVAVFPNDLLVGDQDGVIVIPNHLIQETLEETKKMTIYEKFVQKQIFEGKSIIGLYPLTKPELFQEELDTYIENFVW